MNKYQIQPEYGDEQADAGRDCRTRLARPNFGANGDRGIFIFLVQLITRRIGKLTWLIHALLYVMTIHIERTRFRNADKLVGCTDKQDAMRVSVVSS